MKEENLSDNVSKSENIKVTFEIDKNILNTAAGLIAMQNPEDYNEIMDFALKNDRDEIFVNKDLLRRFAKEVPNLSHVPLFVAIIAFMAMAEEK